MKNFISGINKLNILFYLCLLYLVLIVNIILFYIKDKYVKFMSN